MGQVGEVLNIGQLCRGRFGREAMLIGFGTHTGTVAAATDWDAPLAVKAERPSLSGSYERVSHDSEVKEFLLDLRGAEEGLREMLEEPRLERCIGVLYRPETERCSTNSQAIIPGLFRAWVRAHERRAGTRRTAQKEKGE